MAARNVKMNVEKGILVIKVDLSEVQGPSKSGKSNIIATTEGAEWIEGVSVNLNVYKKA